MYESKVDMDSKDWALKSEMSLLVISHKLCVKVTMC